MPQYRALLTEAGKNRVASAAITGKNVGFHYMGVGDGIRDASPAEGGDTLISERYRAPLNRVVIADQSANIIRAEMIILPQIGGFWLREAALYDDEGVCLAVASLPPSYKPKLEEGSGRLQSVNLWIAVSSTENVELKTDPSVILATLEEVTRAKDEAKDYTDELIGGLEESIQKAIADAAKKAVSDAWEQDNPVGTTRFFNQNLNRMSAGRGRNGYTPVKIKRSGWQKQTAQT